MKNAKTYEVKVKKLLAGIKTVASPSISADQHLRTLIYSILLADNSPKRTDKAIAALEKEFVDFNELRVSQSKEVAECVGKDFLGIRTKAETIYTVLNGLFNQVSDIKMDHIGELGKRDIRRHLRELGCPPFAEALVSMTCYGIHAIPVDDSLRDLLEINEQIHPGSDILDTQAFLERVIPQKKGLAAHEFFREYIAENFAVLQKKRKADAEIRAAEEAAQKAAEEEAARKAAEAAEKAAKLEAERKAEEAEKEAQKAAKKAAKKKADKEAEKAAKKANKKAAKMIEKTKSQKASKKKKK